MSYLGNAAIAPGTSSPKTANVNVFHCSYNHAHIDLLRATAKQLGITLTGSLLPCNSCAQSKGIRKPVSSSTLTRSNKKLQKVYIDLAGPKPVAVRGKSYIMLVRDDFTRKSWIYFLANKSEAYIGLKDFLSDVASEGKVEVIRSDNGGEFRGRFAEVCRDNSILQQFTPPGRPEYNGVAERGISMVDKAQMAARLHAKELYPSENVPDCPSLWYEASLWAVDALNRTATRANPNLLSPDQMWSGKAPPIRLFPFLKPAFCHSKRLSKDLPRAIPCFYLGPAPYHPRDAYRVMTADTRKVVITRDVTWKTLGVANEFQPNEGMSGADASRRDASAAEASKLTNSDQGRQANPEFTGTTLLEAGSRQRRNEDQATKSHVQDGAPTGEANADPPARHSGQVHQDGDGEGSRHNNSPQRRSDPLQHRSALSTSHDTRETPENGDSRGDQLGQNQDRAGTVDYSKPRDRIDAVDNRSDGDRAGTVDDSKSVGRAATVDGSNSGDHAGSVDN